MQSDQPFSRRFGHDSGEAPITVREDAPENLRYSVLQIAHDKCDLVPSTLRDIVCGVLRERPNPSNWSEYPNVWNEVDGLVARCPWFKFYDIVEAIHAALRQRRGDPFAPGSTKQAARLFEEEVNLCYRELGIGWLLVDGLHQSRGDDAFQNELSTALTVTESAGLSTAAGELAEAVRDLSRRPTPDLSGAVHHAMAALEAVARTTTGDSRSVLGDIIKRHPGTFPRPIDECVAKAWGYASENARHGKENRTLSFEEAQLTVGLAAVLSTYLSAKLGTVPA
jgi:hypothetical protein